MVISPPTVARMMIPITVPTCSSLKAMMMSGRMGTNSRGAVDWPKTIRLVAMITATHTAHSTRSVRPDRCHHCRKRPVRMSVINGVNVSMPSPCANSQVRYSVEKGIAPKVADSPAPATLVTPGTIIADTSAKTITPSSESR